MNWKVLEHGGVLLPYVFFFFSFHFFLNPCKYRGLSHSWQSCCLQKAISSSSFFSSFLCFSFFFSLIKWALPAFLGGGQSNAFCISFWCIYRAILLFFFQSVLCFLFSFKALQNGCFQFFQVVGRAMFFAFLSCIYRAILLFFGSFLSCFSF